MLALEQRVADAVGRVLAERHADLERLVDAELERQVAALVDARLVSANGNGAVELPEPETTTCRLCGRAEGPGVSFDPGRRTCRSCKGRRTREQKARAPAVEEAPRPDVDAE